MLRFGFAIAIAIGATSALAANFPSPPLYPSFLSPRQTIETIEPANAAQSSATAINVSGEIAGYFFDNKKGAQHGFIRKTNGKYVGFEAPDANTADGNGTAVTSMNDAGTAMGSYFDSNKVRHAFVRATSGTITEFDAPNSAGTHATHINDKGQISGWFYESGNNDRASFVRGTGGKLAIFNVDGGGNPLDTTAECINSGGIVAGEYYEHSQPQGFVRGAKGKITTFEPAGAVSTYVVAINASNSIAGTFADSHGALHGYIRVAGGTITVIDAPGSGTKSGQGTTLQGIGDSGATIGLYVNSANVAHAFVRSAAGAIAALKVSGAQNVTPLSINNSGAVVGTYIQDNVAHGFLRTP